MVEKGAKNAMFLLGPPRRIRQFEDAPNTVQHVKSLPLCVIFATLFSCKWPFTA